jgi:hypothetical protein
MSRALPLAFAAACCAAATALQAQGIRPMGPWKAERSVRGDTSIVRTVGGSVWGEKVALVEELRIGTKDGDGPDSFGMIQSFAVFPDGMMAVFDGTVPAVRLFSADGKHTRTLGRDGAGPGEYRNQSLGLAVDRTGALLMYDPRNSRINRWKQDGTLLPSWPVNSRLFAAQALQVDTSGTTYIKVLLAPPEEGKEWKIGLARLDPSGVTGDTLQPPVIPGDVPGNGSFFSPYRYWIRTRAGEGVAGYGGVYAVTITGSSGKSLRIERDVPRTLLDPAERRNYQEASDFRRKSDAGNPMIRTTSAPTPVPAEKPYFRFLHSDLDGRIWVDVHGKSESYDAPAEVARPGGPPAGPPIRWREPRSFDVFRRDGTYLGYVQLPFRTTFQEARGDRVWALLRGEDDEMYIVRYRITGMR